MRRAFLSSLGVAVALAFGAPAAGASAADDIPLAVAPCTTIEVGPTGQGGTAGTENQVCLADGVVNVGPSTGQIATITGPTVVGPLTGSVIVAAGNVAIG